jgi:hypothetical protein
VSARRPRGAPAGEGWTLHLLADDGGTVRRVPLPPGEHAVGSVPGCAVVIAEAGVSRRHASVEVLADGGAVVTDAGSKNGTFVAGRRIRRAAVTAAAPVAFGPVRCRLEPADRKSDAVVLAGHDGGRRRGPELDSRPEPLGPEPPTTRSLAAVDRVATSLREALPPLLAGGVDAAETADLHARRWLAALPVGRVLFVRAAPPSAGDETVVAAAATAHRAARDAATVEVAGPDRWRLRLRTPYPEALAPLRSLFEAALALLAAGAARRPAPPGAPPAPRERAAAAAAAGGPAPPDGLGRAMRRLYRQAQRVARGDVPVLILGESGVGKEVLARFVHAASPRRAGPLLAVNCAALPRDLLEAELFGIERGVATGVDARPGILERAAGGTVLLDEIGDMPGEVQAKLLRVLEGTHLYRVGGRTPVAVDVRWIAATNRDLAAAVETGGFRRDLYHRLAALEVTIPPLRERRD